MSDKEEQFRQYQQGPPGPIIFDEITEGEKPLKIITLNTTVPGNNHAVVFGLFSQQALDVSHLATSVMVSSHPFDEDGTDTELGEYYDEYTMFKVLKALTAGGVTPEYAQRLINEIQNEGILFRERR